MTTYGGVSKLVSNVNSLSGIYEEVYEKLKKERQDIFELKTGRLYSIISEILEESNLGSLQTKTEKICTELKIKASHSSIEDDKVIKELSKILLKCKISSHQDSENYMELLIFTACILVGVVACLQYIRHRKKQNHAGETCQSSFVPVAEPSVVAELCLVVPASEVSSLSVGSSIYGNRLKELVTSASYFLCEVVREAFDIEQSLPLTKDPIPTDSPKAVYIRVTIENGQKMIDKTTRYEIKENIEDTKQYQIQKINCLQSLSGLEIFKD